MEHLNIPVFSGQGTTSVNSQRVQDQAVICASAPIGTLLLSSCFEAFHSELSSLSDTEKEITGVNLADFDRPLSLLLIPSNNYLLNPVISGTRLLLLQVLIYLEWTTRTFGVASDTFAPLLQQNCRYGTGIIGFSSGVISACVVGTSATILDFLFNAVSAFRVALWIGVRTQSYRRRMLVVAGLSANDDRSWSRVLLGIGCHTAEEAITQFVQQVNSLLLRPR
jgi:Starter unit:ACP transacylase in aflatoxin biosynthesis